MDHPVRKNQQGVEIGSTFLCRAGSEFGLVVGGGDGVVCTV